MRGKIEALRKYFAVWSFALKLAFIRTLLPATFSLCCVFPQPCYALLL